MKTRARRVTKNKNIADIKIDSAETESVAKKPTFTVISNDETATKQTSVRPKVSTYPKRIKEVVRPEMKAANSNLPELTMPGAVDLDAPVAHPVAKDMNTPPSNHFDWSFAIWLVALVVAVNLALLMLSGSPSKSLNEKSVATPQAAAPAETGVVVQGTVAEEPTTAVVVKPAVAPVAAVVPAVVAPVATAKPVVATPVVSAKPAAPAQSLLSIINQN